MFHQGILTCTPLRVMLIVEGLKISQIKNQGEYNMLTFLKKMMGILTQEKLKSSSLMIHFISNASAAINVGAIPMFFSLATI